MDGLFSFEGKLLQGEAETWLKALEALATSRGFVTPSVYAIVFFRNTKELNQRKLVKITDDVFIGDGIIAVKHTEVPSVLAQRLIIGYYSLCLLAENDHVYVDEVTELAKTDLWLFLTFLSQQFFV